MLQPVPVSLNLLLGEASGMLRRLMPENIELKLALDPRAPDVLVDPGHMLQVVMNLAVNARDAMRGGGTLRIAVVSDGDFAILSVVDDGEGMDEDTLDRIYEPFFTTKPMGEGTGLGLSTVYGIVGQSGGTIDVESAPGRGTRFAVRLPLARPAEGLLLEAVPATLVD
jgi:signal transduction histidine kinase